MFEDINQPPKPLPTPELKVVRPGISLLPPLSRRGHGPGLVVLTPTSGDVLEIKDGVPSVLIKWAEEGYTVVQIKSSVFEGTSSQSVIAEALEALTQCEKCDKGRIGLVGKTEVIIFIL
jgi:carboxymethylenebutenolidase